MKKYWEMGKLNISKNQRYLQNGDTPFFWMGDTAWLLFQQLNLEESYIYLKNRKEKGFNVIQVDFIHEMSECNAYGDLPLVEDDFTNPNVEDGYWEHIDKVITMAEELGIYMAILPVWGSSLVKGGNLTLDNVEEYTGFVSKRYANRPNIIWVVGGDVRADVNLSVFHKMAEILKKNNPEYLVSYHPFGRTTSSIWFYDTPWLDFHMFQSGHRRYDQASLGAWDDNAAKEEFFGEDNWRYVLKDHSIMPVKPTIDAEPSYEHVHQGLHDFTQPFWQAHDVRRYAYWSVFQGAMGHTYGDNSIMQFYKDKNKKPSFGALDIWSDALHHEGSGHMKHLRGLMECVNFVHGHPAEDLLLYGQKEKYERIAVFAGANFILCYTYLGNEVTIDLTKYKEKELEAYWFDPSSGAYSFICNVTGMDIFTAKPIKRVGDSNDWVLVIK